MVPDFSISKTALKTEKDSVGEGRGRVWLNGKC
jgi:hypothetical protein